MEQVMITKDSVIKVENDILYIDGVDCDDSVYFDNVEIKEKFLDFLDEYKAHSLEKNVPLSIDLFQVFNMFRSVLDITQFGHSFSNEYVVKRFSFLEEDSHFHLKYEASWYCIYYFQDEKERGELQEIYVGIPKMPEDHIISAFKVIKDGQFKRFRLREFPEWYLKLHQKAKEETDKMHRLRRLFLT